jgi:hypothetical protein
MCLSSVSAEHLNSFVSAVGAVHLALRVFSVGMPSETKTKASPGCVATENSSYSASGKHAQRKAFGAHGRDLAAAAEDGRNGAGVGYLQGPVVVVPDA